MVVHLQFTKYNSGSNNDAKKNHDEINSYSKCVSLKNQGQSTNTPTSLAIN